MAAERTETSRPTGRGSEQSVGAALQRYRFMAWVVGVLLIALIFVAVPLKHFFDVPGPVAVLGTAHGFLYGLFFLATVDLALRARWTALGTVLTLLAGTVPVLSFFAERTATRKTRAGERV
jgi:integral membrane protein